MSLMLLVPTMNFTRDVVVLVNPVAACRACLDFIEVSFSHFQSP